jgi:hypothetical protein
MKSCRKYVGRQRKKFDWNRSRRCRDMSEKVKKYPPFHTFLAYEYKLCLTSMSERVLRARANSRGGPDFCLQQQPEYPITPILNINLSVLILSYYIPRCLQQCCWCLQHQNWLSGKDVASNCVKQGHNFIINNNLVVPNLSLVTPIVGRSWDNHVLKHGHT